MIYAYRAMRGKTLAVLLYALSIQNLKTHLVLDENCKMWKKRTNFILTDRDKDHSKIQKKNRQFARFGFRNKTQVISSCCLIPSKIPVQQTGTAIQIVILMLNHLREILLKNCLYFRVIVGKMFLSNKPMVRL